MDSELTILNCSALISKLSCFSPSNLTLPMSKFTRHQNITRNVIFMSEMCHFTYILSYVFSDLTFLKC